MPSRKSAPDPENIDQKEVQFFTPATAGRNRTKTCDPRQLVVLKNFTEAIFEILIFSPTFSRILKKVTFSRFFGTPGSLHGLPYTHQHPPEGIFEIFSRFLKFFRLKTLPKDARGPTSTRNFTGDSFLMVSERFRTDLVLKT